MICDEHVQYIYVHVHPQVSTNTGMYTYCTWNVVFSSLCTCMVIVYISYVMHAVIVELLNEKVDYKSIGVPRNMESLPFGGVYKGSAQGTALAATFEKDYNKMAPVFFPSFMQTIRRTV